MDGMELPTFFQYICFVNLKSMFKKAKMVLIVLMLSSVGFSAMADKGIGKKNKSKVSLNINSGNTLRNSIALNLKSGPPLDAKRRALHRVSPSPPGRPSARERASRAPVRGGA